MTGFIGVETGVPGMPALLHIVEERTHKVVWRAKGEKRKKRDYNAHNDLNLPVSATHRHLTYSNFFSLYHGSYSKFLRGAS